MSFNNRFMRLLLIAAVIAATSQWNVNSSSAQQGFFSTVVLDGGSNGDPQVVFLQSQGVSNFVTSIDEGLRFSISGDPKVLFGVGAEHNALQINSAGVNVNDLILRGGNSDNPWIRFDQTAGSPHFLASWDNRLVMYVDNSPKVYVYENAEPGALRVGVNGVNVNDLILRGGNGDNPFIRFDQANGDRHSITTTTDNMRFRVDNDTKIRINQDAQTDSLVIGANAVIAKGLTVRDYNLSLKPVASSSDGPGLFTINGTDIGLRTENARHPFYISRDAQDASLNIYEQGVGIGRFGAQEMLHVYSDGRRFANAKLLVENDHNTVTQREMLELVNNGGLRIALTDTDRDSSWLLATDTAGRYNVTLEGTGGTEFSVFPNGRVIMGPGPVTNFDLTPNGNLIIQGTLTQSSDKNLKTAFEDVDPNEVLQRVVEMPVTTWQFKFDEPELRHMGPTAQDFRAAFGLGIDDKTIAPVDGIGVALAAIKALHNQNLEKNRQLQEQQLRITAQQDKISGQQQTLTEQQELLEQLASRVEQLEATMPQ